MIFADPERTGDGVVTRSTREDAHGLDEARAHELQILRLAMHGEWLEAQIDALKKQVSTSK